MRAKFFPIILVIFFSIIFLIFYKGLQNSNIYVPDNNTNKEIPNFEAKMFDTENKINSNDIFKTDQFYLMNIWASWCVPCKEEHPLLMNLKDLDNLEIIGLNYKDKIDNAKSFLEELDNPYKIIFSDKDGIIAIEWGAYGVPETFLIYDKKIIKKFVGPLNENLLTEIKNQLNELF